jgi:hypothetical protein
MKVIRVTPDRIGAGLPFKSESGIRFPDLLSEIKSG